MGLALTIARRSLLERRGRTLFSVLGIALGVATAVGVVTLDESTVRGIVRTSSGGPDLEVAAGPGSAGREELEAVEGVRGVASFFQNEVLARLPGGASDEGERVRLYAFRGEDLEGLDQVRLAAGRSLAVAADGTREREVLVGAELAAELGLEVGADLLLARPARAARRACKDGELTLVGRAAADEPPELAFTVVGLLARERIGHRAGGRVVVVDEAWGQELFRGAHVARRFWVQRDPAVDIERLRSSLGLAFAYELDRSVIRGEEADERAFRTGVRMAGLLALVLGLYVIFHTLSMSLAERVAEVGTLHALGVTRAQMARIFLLEAVLLAGSGALLGLALGIGLAQGLLGLGITTLGLAAEELLLIVPWGLVLSLTAAGFAVALVGSIYPMARLGGADTVAALRGEEALARTGMGRGFQLFTALLLAVILPGLYFALVPAVGEYTAPLVGLLLSAVGFLALLVVLPLWMPRVVAGLCAALTGPLTRLWPLSGRLAARGMRQSAARIAVSASAIALVTAGLVGLKGMTRSLHGEVEQWADEAVVDKVWVRRAGHLAVDAVHGHLSGYPGYLGLEVGAARTFGSFLIVGVDPERVSTYGPLAGDPALRRALEQEHGMILSRRLARERRYEVGDVVPVEKADGSLQDFRVVAISDAYGYAPHPDERMYGVVAQAYLERYFCLDTSSSHELVVRLERGTDPEVVRTALMELDEDARAAAPAERGRRGGEDADRRPPWSVVLGALNPEAGRDVLADQLDNIQRDFVLFDVLLVLTAALAGLGVLNGQLLAALERSKELGVLKALGTTRRQVAGMVLIESLVVGLVGGAVGAGLGAVLVPVVVEALEDLAGLELPVLGAGPWLWAGLGLALVVTLLSALYPIWRMNRFDAVRAVRSG